MCSQPSIILWTGLDIIIGLLNRHSKLLRGTEVCSNLFLWNVDIFVLKALLNNNVEVTSECIK